LANIYLNGTHNDLQTSLSHPTLEQWPQSSEL
jgi:hypothetical protein